MSRDDLVHWSVMEANRRRVRSPKSIGRRCRRCGKDAWIIRNGVAEEYRSEHNPGEYVEFTCTDCGYMFEEPC